MKSAQHKLSNEWSHDMVWGGIQKSKFLSTSILTPKYGGGSWDPCRVCRLSYFAWICFTLEMATFELVTQHIAWIFNFNIPLLLCTISPIHYAKFKKNSYSQSRAIRMGHFWVQNGRFALNKHFLGKIINIILIFLLTHFTVPI